MAIDTETPYSPGWWLKTLAKQLQDRRNGRKGGKVYTRQSYKSDRIRPGVDLLDAYYHGDPPLRQVATEWEGYVREFIRMGRLNIADLLVTATANRMQLRDFRTAAANDELGDDVARDIMKANDAATKFKDIHEWLFAHGDSYGIITPASGTRKHALLTAESAQQVITAHDAATGRTLAGLKLFRDDWDSADLAYVFSYDNDYDDYDELDTPRVWRAIKRKGPTSITDQAFRMARSWEWDDNHDPEVPGAELPIVRYRNRKGIGEFEEHLSTLDRINDKIANEWWIGKIQAFRQRAVKNLPERDEKTGEKIDWSKVFVADPGAFWNVPDAVEFWESGLTDMTPLFNSIKKDLEHLAAATSNPLHTITPDAASGSAEGASLLREEHVFKIEDRIIRTSGSHARTMSLLLQFSDIEGARERTDVAQIVPMWGPVERHSLQQKAEGVAKMWGKLPDARVFTDILQYPPSEVAELRKQQGQDLLLRPTQPEPAPAVTDGND